MIYLAFSFMILKLLKANTKNTKRKSKSLILIIRWVVPVREDTCPTPSAS